MIKKNKIKKYSEIIIAGAIGDAYGFPVEFYDLEKIINIYGKNGIQLNNIDYWIVSDDTQMTLFCLDIISEEINNDNLENINEKLYDSYQNWFNTQYKNESNNIEKKLKNLNSRNNFLLSDFKSMQVKRAPGITCLSALGSKNFGTMYKKINDSKGCGGIMRVAPIAFLNLKNEKIFELGAMQAALTHGHENGYLSAGFFACLLKNLIDGKTLIESYNISEKILKTYKNSKNMLEYLDILKKITKEKIKIGKNLNDFLGKGYVGEEALGIALYSVFFAKNFEECLSIAVNHDGDSDSTGSLAGQLYVALNNLPEKYYQIEFDISDSINYILKKLTESLNYE